MDLYLRHAEIIYEDASLLARLAKGAKRSSVDFDKETGEWIQILSEIPSELAHDEHSQELVEFLKDYRSPKGGLKIIFSPKQKLYITSIDLEKMILSILQGLAGRLSV
jgi:hypothetical protein